MSAWPQGGRAIFKTSQPPSRRTRQALPKYKEVKCFGSSKSMAIENQEEVPLGFVLCKDEYGEYLTELNRLDSGLADPNRYMTARLDKLFNAKKENKG